MADVPIPIRVVSQAEAEQATVLVCVAVRDLPAGKSFFADDLRGTCADCSTEIIFRPHAPKTPRKLCIGCAGERMKGVQA